jgi:hypothetical protein
LSDDFPGMGVLLSIQTATHKKMIKPNAKLTIMRITLENLIVKEYQERFPDRLMHYIKLLKEHPDEYPGLISVTPSDTHPGLYVVLDGHHRLWAALMCGRTDMLCVVIEEPAS